MTNYYQTTVIAKYWRLIKYKVTLAQQIVCWLIRLNSMVKTPAQISQQKYENISSAISSHHISDKNSESKYNCHEKFLKNLLFGIDFKLYVPPLMLRAINCIREWLDLQLKVDSERQIFQKLFMAIIFTLRVFA